MKNQPPCLLERSEHKSVVDSNGVLATCFLTEACDNMTFSGLLDGLNVGNLLLLSSLIAANSGAATDIVRRIVVGMTSHLLDSTAGAPKCAAAIITTTTARGLNVVLLTHRVTGAASANQDEDTKKERDNAGNQIQGLVQISRFFDRIIRALDFILVFFPIVHITTTSALLEAHDGAENSFDNNYKKEYNRDVLASGVSGWMLSTTSEGSATHACHDLTNEDRLEPKSKTTHGMAWSKGATGAQTIAPLAGGDVVRDPLR